MLNYLKKCFAPTPIPTKEYIYSAVTQSREPQFATVTIEITASTATVEELHKVLTATAYQLLADSVRTK